MNLFIDTNIFLSFYHLTNDDLEELRKLSVLLATGEVTLFLTDQVIDELERNRENKIADAIKRLKDQHLNLQFPQLCKDYEEYSTLRELQQQYEVEHSKLLTKILADVSANTLKADQVIDDLFENARIVKTSDALIQRARLRMEVGNPPGKNGSLGDAINWESVLEAVPDGEELFLVADDKDYYSPIDENNLKEFLLREWLDVKKSNVIVFRRLSTFFKKHFSQIKLASELEKELLIRKLASSGSFATTHSVVAQLAQFDGFSSIQVNEIVEATLSNRQVRWIICDDDVNEFLCSFANTYKDQIEDKHLEALTKELAKCIPSEDENDEIPF